MTSRVCITKMKKLQIIWMNMDIDEDISDDRKKLLKKRTTLDTEPRMKHLLERWITIEKKHLLNAICLSLFRLY